MVGSSSTKQELPSWVGATTATRTTVEFEKNVVVSGGNSSSTEPSHSKNFTYVNLRFGERAIFAVGSAVVSAILVNPLESNIDLAKKLTREFNEKQVETLIDKDNKDYNNKIGIKETLEKETLEDNQEGKQIIQYNEKIPTVNEQAKQIKLEEEQFQDHIKLTESAMRDSEAEKETSVSHIESKESNTIVDVEKIHEGILAEQVQQTPIIVDPGERSSSKDKQSKKKEVGEVQGDN
ncbi:hypothetical protein HAX54_031858 [Datura stramonium]|uniref:Uncharacterized protein n=1 Tax=Datura stramonium TaxID=4076 RepID=A0ABS8SC80_DATST|nr:hypothetical protein [Datura stramonium]